MEKEITLIDSAGNWVWLKPVVLTGTSFADVTVSAVSTEPPHLYSLIEKQEQLMPSDITQIKIEDKKAASLFEIMLPQANVAPIFQESLHIRTANHGMVCEPKACNLWVLKHLAKAEK